MEDSRLAFLQADGLARIRKLQVAVVGAGGSGSHIVQQLAHLRVGKIIVIDPDVLDPSNVNRAVLTHPGLVGQQKAEILSRRLRKLRADIAPLVERAESADGIAWRFCCCDGDLLTELILLFNE